MATNGLVTTNTNDTIDHNHTLTASTYYSGYVNNVYPYYASGYTCGNCGVWVSYNTFHQCYAQPVHTHTIVTMPPVPDPAQREILEELKLMREALETLVDRTHNVHEEVRGSDEGRGGDPASDTEGSRTDEALDDLARVAKRFGLC